MDIDELKRLIFNRGFNIVSFSDAVGIDRSTLYRRLADSGSTFTIEEIKRIKEVLNINDEKATQIFLS
ncbi:XRE family transcriptional regulator [Veillonella montpellierensis]|uniref:XRE family transcriptional regulator n=1 Tax=Veillonella montpellierensis TaxID=187328 RepID=UPI0023F93F53|nr:XRE family transcriptional regulator [Veillonella montpellierensis]